MQFTLQFEQADQDTVQHISTLGPLTAPCPGPAIPAGISSTSGNKAHMHATAQMQRFYPPRSNTLISLLHSYHAYGLQQLPGIYSHNARSTFNSLYLRALNITQRKNLPFY